jgi:hypothetical protein
MQHAIPCLQTWWRTLCRASRTDRGLLQLHPAAQSGDTANCLPGVLSRVPPLRRYTWDGLVGPMWAVIRFCTAMADLTLVVSRTSRVGDRQTLASWVAVSLIELCCLTPYMPARA